MIIKGDDNHSNNNNKNNNHDDNDNNKLCDNMPLSNMCKKKYKAVRLMVQQLTNTLYTRETLKTCNNTLSTSASL